MNSVPCSQFTNYWILCAIFFKIFFGEETNHETACFRSHPCDLFPKLPVYGWGILQISTFITSFYQSLEPEILFNSCLQEAVNSTSQASIDAMENEAPVANMTSKDPTIARPNEAKFEAKLSSLPSKVSVNDLTAIATAAASAYKQYMSATAEKAPRNEAPVVVRTDKSPKVVSKDKAPIVASENKTAVLGSTYTAAVVEMQANESQSTAEITERFVKIIQSREVNEVDILIFPELIVNSPKTALLLPNSTSYCDDANAHFFFRKISCAVRKVPKYVLVNLYVQINCSLDDQAFCAHNETSTNVYNMAIVFDRHGDVIAKWVSPKFNFNRVLPSAIPIFFHRITFRYRKFNLFSEVGTQAPAKPDLTTFRTDFNVTFGVFICFDLLNKEPAITLVNRGIRHFVHPAMWYATLPYYSGKTNCCLTSLHPTIDTRLWNVISTALISALQYQQSWAIANNVNLLAANGNDVRYGCTGSGIYSGRTGALEMFVSEQPATKILIAKVPKDDFEYTLNKTLQIGSPKKLKQNALNNGIGGMSKFLQTKLLRSKESALKLSHEDFTDFSVHFLDFSRDLNQTGRVCNRAICCDYNIEVNHVAGTDSTVRSIRSSFRELFIFLHSQIKLLIGSSVSSRPFITMPYQFITADSPSNKRQMHTWVTTSAAWSLARKREHTIHVANGSQMGSSKIATRSRNWAWSRFCRSATTSPSWQTRWRTICTRSTHLNGNSKRKQRIHKIWNNFEVLTAFNRLHLISGLNWKQRRNLWWNSLFWNPKPILSHSQLSRAITIGIW